MAYNIELTDERVAEELAAAEARAAELKRIQAKRKEMKPERRLGDELHRLTCHQGHELGYGCSYYDQSQYGLEVRDKFTEKAKQILEITTAEEAVKIIKIIA